MGRIILFLLISLSLHSQVRKSGPNYSGDTIVTIDGVDYVATGVLDGSSRLFHYSFLEDARLRGYDFSNERGTLTVGWLPPSVAGRSYDSCAPGYDIDINGNYWATASYRQKKVLIYHEFGHALMNLRHACLEQDLGDYWGVRDVIDIMTDTAQCPRLAQNDPPFPLPISVMVDRFFTPETQRYLTYSNCPSRTTGKGSSRGTYIDN